MKGDDLRLGLRKPTESNVAKTEVSKDRPFTSCALE